jgi:hypothetical protein
MTRIQELREELRTVFAGRGIKLLDSILPLIVFLLLNWLADLNSALIAAVIAAGMFLIYRSIKRDNLVYALVGLAGVGLAAGFAYLSGSSSGFFLPGIISGWATVLICVGSVLVKRPVAAWTSMLTRRWPQEWYWLDQIRPAYSEVTLIWAGAFGLRTGLEMWLLSQSNISALGILKIILGWPFTILVLVLSYLFGIWRLGNLGGPSVEEFVNDIDPPWGGQKRGF